MRAGFISLPKRPTPGSLFRIPSPAFRVSVRPAFTLLEVLAATAIFGIATAGLFMAFAPTHEALFRLSNIASDDGDLEIAKAFAADAPDRDTLLRGLDTTLPDGRTLRWRAEITPTDTEALFRVFLTAERDGAPPLTADYLHFEPRWLLPTDEKPRWLTHSASSPSAPPGGGGTPGKPPPGGKPGSGQASGEKPSGGKPGGDRPSSGRPQNTKPGGGPSAPPRGATR